MGNKTEAYVVLDTDVSNKEESSKGRTDANLKKRGHWAKGSDASELLWHYVTILLSKKKFPACPSHRLLGHPPISVVEEGILSQSIYKTEAVFYLCCSEEASAWQLPENAAVLQVLSAFVIFCQQCPAQRFRAERASVHAFPKAASSTGLEASTPLRGNFSHLLLTYLLCTQLQPVPASSQLGGCSRRHHFSCS